MDIEHESGLSPEELGLETKESDEKIEPTIETKVSSYDEDIDDVVLELESQDGDSEIILSRLEGENAQEILDDIQSGIEKGNEDAAEALSEAKLTKENLLEIKASFDKLMEESDISDPDSYADMAVKIVETHYGAKKEIVYEAFKNLGLQGFILNGAESYYHGFRAAFASSDKERQDSLQKAWSAAKQVNPALLFPEVLYRAQAYLRGDETEREQQKQGITDSIKESSAAWKWMIGNEDEKREVLDQGKAMAIMTADAVTLGSAAMYGLTKETMILAKDAHEVSAMFTSRIDNLEKRLDAGEEITVWDLSSEFIQAGMEATGKEPEEVLDLMGETLKDPEFMKRLPEKQKDGMKLIAEILQNEDGKKEILKRIRDFDARIQEKKQN